MDTDARCRRRLCRLHFDIGIDVDIEIVDIKVRAIGNPVGLPMLPALSMLLSALPRLPSR